MCAPTQSSIQNHFNINLPDFLAANRRPFDLGSSPPAVKNRKKSSCVPDSSPVLSDDEPDTELDRYFAYLADKFKKDVGKLTEAKTALANQDLDLRGIHETDVKVIEGYGITYGLALKIKRCIKEFQVVAK